MEITRISLLSGKKRTKDLPITQEQYNAWEKGTPAQVVFKHLTPDQREFIITGSIVEEWDAVFKEE